MFNIRIHLENLHVQGHNAIQCYQLSITDDTKSYNSCILEVQATNLCEMEAKKAFEDKHGY